jgi:uncharacterized membrane protein YfcA
LDQRLPGCGCCAAQRRNLLPIPINNRDRIKILPFDLPTFDAAFFALAITVFVAGVARGLAGFGTGMIVAPVAGALYDPLTAVVLIVVIDLLPALPVTIPALKIAKWREVLPILAGMALTVPAGVWLVANAPEFSLRLGIAAVILFCAAALWRGWRYQGERTVPKSLGVGAVAGVLSGVAQIPGPPVLIYWLASPLPAAIVRANLLTLFFLSTFLMIGNLYAGGLFTQGALMLGLVTSPFYFAGILTGWAFYGRTSDARYRQITLGLVVMSALLSLPWREMFGS